MTEPGHDAEGNVVHPEWPRSPSPGWWERHWKWFVPAGCLMALVVFLAFGLAFAALLFYGIRTTDIYAEAVDRVRHDTRVVEALGEPIRPGWWVTGSISTSGSTGEADLTIPISGSDGDATIYLFAHKESGRWIIETLEVVVDEEHGFIDLMAPEEATADGEAGES